MRILIAEDSHTCRLILSGTLREQGYDVVDTVNGVQALNMLLSPGAPRLAILDWMMPEMDGLEVVKRVRKQTTVHPPYIIMLTSRSNKKDIIVGLDAGANDYLGKPFDPSELLARVEVGRRMVELQDALIESREKLSYQATHDPLTGIFNRRAVLERLSEKFFQSESSQDILAAGICDIDHFKLINDTFGHQTGDELLCGLTKFLCKYFSHSDHIGRIGGEEFLIVTQAKTQEEIKHKFNKCCQLISHTKFETRAGALSIYVSMGVASTKDLNSVDELLSAADAALYQAKYQGRNRVNYANLS